MVVKNAVFNPVLSPATISLTGADPSKLPPVAKTNPIIVPSNPNEKKVFYIQAIY